MDKVSGTGVTKTLVAMPAGGPDQMKGPIWSERETGVTDLPVGADVRFEKSSGDVGPVVTVKAIEEAKIFLVGVME